VQLHRRLVRRLGRQYRRLRTPRRPDTAQREDASSPAGPRAVYARILDGETLWAAVSAEAAGEGSSLAMRDTETGELTVLDTAHQGSGAGTMLTTRHVLHEPTSAAELREGGCFDLVVVDDIGHGNAGTYHPVRASNPKRTLGATRTPPTRDNRRQFQLRVCPDETLQLSCSHLPPTALIDSVSVVENALLLSCSLPTSTEADVDLRLVADDAVLARVELSLDDRQASARVRPEAFRDASEQPARLLVGTATGNLPLHRRSNALVDAHAAVPMPVLELNNDAGDTLRLSYQVDGSLTVRRVVGRGDES
jgi:hypothetical protein